MTINNYTERDLERIQEYAEATLSPSEIATLLELPADEHSIFVEMVKNHHSHAFHIAYQKGVLTTKFNLRRTVIKLATAGSPAAEPIALKFLKDID